jgi:hypothetical protein
VRAAGVRRFSGSVEALELPGPTLRADLKPGRGCSPTSISADGISQLGIGPFRRESSMYWTSSAVSK